MGFSPEEFFMLCATISVCLLMVCIIFIKTSTERKKLHLPPSPPGSWPILGHLHILQLPLHHTLHKLAHTYGPLFYIKMGSLSAVVFSSPDWAKEFWYTHDREFADRPQFEASKRLFYNNKTMIMMEYGSVWRDLRKLYTTQVLSSKRIDMFENARHDEMAMLMKLIQTQALIGGVGVDLRKLVFNTLGNMMTRMLFSKRSFDVTVAMDGTESRFKQMVGEMGEFFGTPILGDLIPWLSWLDLHGYKKKMDKLAKEVDTFFEDVVVQRIESRGISDADEDTNSDYLDLLLRIYNKDGQVDKESIKCILLDLLGSGAETSSTTIEWALAELVRNPDCMKKLQEELDTLVAEDGALNMTSKCVKDVEIAKLSYLQAVVKETLRLHPPLSINMRQMCKEFENGIQVRGYDLPKKTRVLFNLWSMGRDTTLWGANADTFCPDRFLSGSMPDLRGQHFEFLPFGTGRRVCPGMNLALTLVPFVVANLVQVFDWKVPHGASLDLLEAAASFITSMAKPLVAIPTLRVST